ncbi:MAG: hypothetical protein IJ641_07105 [Lachnospiraceae bacterium]|nr:hypothetical protein [Lachnospiraceae bacterium]
MTQNPFTHTYGSAGQAYIDMGWAEKATSNFDFETPSEYVYKIIGVRGSGKTVVLSDIIRYYRKQENIDKGWLVYDLSSARDPLHTLVAFLAKEKFSGSKKKSISLSANATLGILSGGINTAQPSTDNYYDDEVELDVLLDRAISNGKRILVCIDDIAKSDAVVAFCSVFAKYIRAEKPVYLVCTGLFSNMESIGRVRNLTFFKRAETIEVRSLSEVSMTMKYKKLLDLSSEKARELAKITRGYAYGYQVLGSLYFNKKTNESLKDLMDDFDERLFSQSYEKIWEELREGERKLIHIMLDYHKREDILLQMDAPGNYSEYRNSLIRGGVIHESRRGEIAFSLPRFEEYVREFC